MIIDSIKNSSIYCSENPAFKEAFGFIGKAVTENLPEGKYPLDGKSYAIVQCYTPKENSGKFEAHRNFIDIQFIAHGTECMEWCEISGGTVTQEYNPESDVEFFSAKPEAKLTLNDGYFAVFFPNDLHNPGVAPKTPVPVKKIIVKVKN